jgi:hypothetical protein
MIRVTRQIKCLIAQAPVVIPHPLHEVNFILVAMPIPKPYIFMILVNRQIKCPDNLFFVLWNLMISWIVFILHRKIFPIHHTYIYSLVSYLFIKQDQMILTCNSAVESLMVSRFLYKFKELISSFLIFDDMIFTPLSLQIYWHNQQLRSVTCHFYALYPLVTIGECLNSMINVLSPKYSDTSIASWHAYW